MLLNEVGTGAARTVTAEIEPGPASGTWSVTFHSQAAPGTLAVFAGTLSAARLDIISAVIRVSEGSVADAFDIAAPADAQFGPREADRLASFASDALNGSHDLEAELRELRGRQPRRATAEPRVTFQTDSSITTGINVVCADRPGLLFDLTSTLTKHGMRTRALSVLTFHQQAHDTFRVVDSRGCPPSDATSLDALCEELRRACS